ncbi:MAG: branched-chain amino acid ABC transporter permease [Deltaproteobacteria bacterium]|nr:branched-chain amino acid ABC transporter permease [Deltaproteobacteria bacterium]MCZ6546647.1 branched-chain amino acid ABC transporter permease [Deltaproteobacteria bacterium]
MILFVQAVINGVLIGSIYGLSALGLTLVWGIMDIVNLAHGEFIILGAFMNYFLFTLLGVNPLVGVLLAIPAGVVVGGVIHLLFIRRVIGRSGLTTLLLTFGLSVLGNNIMLQLFAGEPRSIQWIRTSLELWGFFIPVTRLIAFCLVLAMAAFLFYFLERTYPGKAIRAIMQDSEAAAAMGIPTGSILLLCFIIGTVLAMMAGTLVSIVLPFQPAFALQYTITSFVITVVGGLGRPAGALVGGLLVGILESFTGTFISQAYTPITVSVLLIGFLLVRPAGLFGYSTR